MEQAQIPESNAQKFMKSKPAMLLGAALALGLGILLMYLGLFNQCCGLGYLLVACVALYIPKMFGMTKMQYLAVFGVVFFLVLTALGAMLVSKPMFESNNDIAGFDDSGFSNIRIEVVGDGANLTVDYTGEGTEPAVYVYQVTTVTYQMITKTKDDISKHALAETGAGTKVYTATIDELPSGFVYQIMFEYRSGEDTETSSYVYYTGVASDSDIQKFCLIYNAYTCGIVILLFYLMMVLTAWSRKNLEKTRARMEAEGRLYPQGYGRCKECGSIVLPGETCCRKCGAYIDVPDELRHRKVDMVECSECGAEIPEDAKICPKCGAVFDEEEEVVYVDSKEEEKKE